MNIGIFGGSFNPIHVGHCILANVLSQSGLVDEVWLTVSAQNPLKSADVSLERHRLEMARIAVEQCERVNVCDVEMSMPKPSYTIDTLNRLSQMYPEHRFRLIIGADNWQIFDRWRESRRIVEHYGVIVYPRRGYEMPCGVEGVTAFEAPLIEISSTQIRESISRGDDVRFMVPDSVYDYIKKNKLYG